MHNSDNENTYHSKFALYTKRSSLADISQTSYHFIVFELINPLLYIYFGIFECKIFFERSEVYVAVVCCVMIS